MDSTTSDFITKISQTQKPLDLDPFPEIPDPPLGFDPERNPFKTEGVSSVPPYLGDKKTEYKYIPFARVFWIAPEGCPEFDELLKRGASGEILIAKKEVADVKGTSAFKVYVEWLEQPNANS
jgi:hypothetical protein